MDALGICFARLPSCRAETRTFKDAGTNAVAARRAFAIGNDHGRACAADDEQADDPGYGNAKFPCAWIEVLKREKGIWWMPWHREAMKDVALCEKLRGGESNL